MLKNLLQKGIMMLRSFIKNNKQDDFYNIDLEATLRFGDVITGFVNVVPNIENLQSIKPGNSYNVKISHYDYFVVITPCCSIEKKVLSLCPLIPIQGTFFNNPFWTEDFTRLNRKMEPEQTVSPMQWNSMEDEKKQEIISNGLAYTFLNLFIFKDNPVFPKYMINRKNGRITTSTYMIDFKDIFKVDSELIERGKPFSLESKVLQLSIKTRGELRDKISYYFGRLPLEDTIV